VFVLAIRVFWRAERRERSSRESELLRVTAVQTLLFCGSLAALPVSLKSQPSPLAQAEALFADRDHGDALKKAVSSLESWLKEDPANYQALWRLSKYKYYLSHRESGQSAKIKLLEQAIENGKQAVQRDNTQPEGHFWLAVSYGRYAELKGLFSSLWLLKTIRSGFETVFKIDANHEDGSVYLALGEMDIRLPWFFGGNTRRGISRLEDGLRLNPRNAELARFLGETYLKAGRREEGRKLLLSVMKLDDPCRSPKELAEIRTGVQQELDNLP
jgi:tetratricopeptide (TPR) repeat protein